MYPIKTVPTVRVFHQNCTNCTIMSIYRQFTVYYSTFALLICQLALDYSKCGIIVYEYCTSLSWDVGEKQLSWFTKFGLICVFIPCLSCSSFDPLLIQWYKIIVTLFDIFYIVLLTLWVFGNHKTITNKLNDERSPQISEAMNKNDICYPTTLCKLYSLPRWYMHILHV